MLDWIIGRLQDLTCWLRRYDLDNDLDEWARTGHLPGRACRRPDNAP